MPELSSLTRQKLVTTVIDLGDGDTVNVTFDRNRVTPFWAQEANRRDDAADPLSVSKAIADVIVEWDVTADGKPFAPTAENVSVLSYPAQKALLTRILEAAVPSDAEGKAFASPSPTQYSGSEAVSATFPNGTSTSTSGVPSAYRSQT